MSTTAISSQPSAISQPAEQFEQMPLVVVKYAGLQEGFAQLAPRALFNVMGGEVPALLHSTVTLESLFAKGYRVKELKPEATKRKLTWLQNFWCWLTHRRDQRVRVGYSDWVRVCGKCSSKQEVA